MRAKRLQEPVFDDLAAANGEDLISVFIPTHSAGPEVAQDRIRLKNQLSSVEESLTDLGWKPRERGERLAQGRRLLDDVEFWEHQAAGLALYVDDSGGVTAVSSSKPLEPFEVVMPVFMIRPLIADIHPLSAPVLVLTMEEVSLFEASAHSATAMDVDLPSYEDVNWFVDRETQRQQHPGRGLSGSNRHGHRSSTKSDEDFARFLREVDAALVGFDDTMPLIVLGDDHMVSRFSNLSDRQILSPEHSGISSPLAGGEVHDMVAETIAGLDHSRVDSATARARDKLGVGMGVTSIDDALPAAVSGRVDEVVMDRNADAVWGRLDESSLTVDVHEERRPGDVDLLDRLLVWSRDKGGTVVSSEVPVEDRAFIATFRY